MKQSIIFLAVIFLNIFTSLAQMSKIENETSFVKKMELSASAFKSMESDFKQIKRIGAFNQDINSSGKFYYKANDKIALNYTAPLSYLVVINGDKMKMESDGKKNIMSLKDNKQMFEMNNILMACMTGNFSKISNTCQLKYYEDNQQYLVSIEPKNENVKKYIIRFDIYLNKKDLSVDTLRVSETENDYTEYHFSNKKYNTLINDSLFKL